MSFQVESPEKKKRKTEDSSPPPSPPSSSPPSFSLLPNEIAVNCLARISRSYYPTLSIVSKSFRSLLSSTELYAARSHLGKTEKCLYVCLWDLWLSYQFPQWFALWVNPNRTLPNSSVSKKKKKKKTIGKLLVPIPCSNFPSLSRSIVSVGSEIYVIGGQVDGARSSAVRILDCRSHTWRDAPSMIVSSKSAVSCVHDGKIYVMGGWGVLEDESWAEVFDTKTQTWESFPDPFTEVRNCYIYRIAAMDGKIYFETVCDMYAYDTKLGKWECCENKSATFSMSQCVMENVWYSYDLVSIYGQCMCKWYDIKGGNWKEVKGLDSLAEKHMRTGGSDSNKTKLVSCGGKLLLIWEACMKRDKKKKIWCAEIVVEKRDGGEVWGNVEWVDVVLTVSASCQLLHCLVVSA